MFPFGSGHVHHLDPLKHVRCLHGNVPRYVTYSLVNYAFEVYIISFICDSSGLGYYECAPGRCE